MSDSVRAAIATVLDGGSLSREEARQAMGSVMDGEATPAQLGGLLVGLRMRGETVDELAGFATAMRERVIRVDAPAGTIDTCGTGGDGRGTFNVSTAVALVVAAAGQPVAKHGGRAVTSGCGSSDVIESLGIRTDLNAGEAARSLRDDAFAFLFAPNFHPAMKHAAPVRRELAVRTSFNLLGPLTNPAGVTRQLLGVADESIAVRLANVLQALGVERAFVVHGERIDELPLDASGVIYDVTARGIEQRHVDPHELGLDEAPAEAFAGGGPEQNARLIEEVLSGAGGPRRDVVLLNAAAAFEVAGRADSLEDGLQLAARTIDEGKAGETLSRLRERRSSRTAAAPVA
jgi:anthranilate phosphoribosyltransferase